MHVCVCVCIAVKRGLILVYTPTKTGPHEKRGHFSGPLFADVSFCFYFILEHDKNENNRRPSFHPNIDFCVTSSHKSLV